MLALICNMLWLNLQEHCSWRSQFRSEGIKVRHRRKIALNAHPTNNLTLFSKPFLETFRRHVSTTFNYTHRFKHSHVLPKNRVKFPQGSQSPVLDDRVFWRRICLKYRFLDSPNCQFLNG